MLFTKLSFVSTVDFLVGSMGMNSFVGLDSQRDRADLLRHLWHLGGFPKDRAGRSQVTGLEQLLQMGADTHVWGGARG